MNDITNTVNNGDHRGSPVTLKASRSPSPSPSPSSSRPTSPLKGKQQRLIMPNPPPFLHKQDSSISTLSRTQYQHKLRQKRSRLDMLDQQLTSFPLAPPPLKDSQKVTEVLRSPDINAVECNSSPSDSQIFSEIDPIVLVEDYIANSRSTRKKLSVSDLKASLKNFDTTSTHGVGGQENYLTKARSILETHVEYETKKRQRRASEAILRKSSNTSSLLLTTNTVSSSDHQGSIPGIKSSKSTMFFSAKTSQSFEMAQFDFPDVTEPYADSLHSLGSLASSLPTLKLTDEFDMMIPTAEFTTRDTRLKSCVICETPLYDISSHCGDGDQFMEFVCSHCTEKHEMLSKLLDRFDEAVSCLNTIPEDVEDIEEALAQPAVKRQKNEMFSKTLLDGLKRQLNGGKMDGFVDRKSAQWFLEAKKKLRWRWRISGLLPQFLKDNQ